MDKNKLEELKEELKNSLDKLFQELETTQRVRDNNEAFYIMEKSLVVSLEKECQELKNKIKELEESNPYRMLEEAYNKMQNLVYENQHLKEILKEHGEQNIDGY